MTYFSGLLHTNKETIATVLAKATCRYWGSPTSTECVKLIVFLTISHTVTNEESIHFKYFNCTVQYVYIDYELLMCNVAMCFTSVLFNIPVNRIIWYSAS